MTDLNTRVCPHEGLWRRCELCGYQADLDAANAEVKALRASRDALQADYGNHVVATSAEIDGLERRIDAVLALKNLSCDWCHHPESSHDDPSTACHVCTCRRFASEVRVLLSGGR